MLYLPFLFLILLFFGNILDILEVHVSISLVFIFFFLLFFFFRIFFLRISKKDFLPVITAVLLILPLIPYSLNVLSFPEKKEVITFALIMPSLLYLTAFLISYSGSVNNLEKKLDRYEKLIILFFIIDLVISYIESLLLTLFPNFKRILYLSERMNSIIFAPLDEPRIPGIFNSGGANGFFLIVGMNTLYFKFPDWKKKLLLLAISTPAIIFTYTRKIYLIYLFWLIFITYYEVARKVRIKGEKIPSLLFVFIIIFLTAFLLLILMSQTQITNDAGIFQADSFFTRLKEWNHVLDVLSSSSIFHFFFGFGVLQSILDKFNRYGLPIYIDNMFISLIAYGGITYLLVYLLLISTFIIQSWRKWKKEKSLLAYKNLFLLGILIFHGIFSVTWSSYEVTIYLYPYIYLIHRYITSKCLLGHRREE